MPARGRILVVDDERNARTALAEILREEGFAVDTAPDALHALPKIDAFAPEVVLTDLRMPGMDGIDLMKEAAGHACHPAVIFMTALGARDPANGQTPVDYLTKPIDVNKLLELLDRTLARRAGNSH